MLKFNCEYCNQTCEGHNQIHIEGEVFIFCDIDCLSSSDVFRNINPPQKQKRKVENEKVNY